MFSARRIVEPLFTDTPEQMDVLIERLIGLFPPDGGMGSITSDTYRNNNWMSNNTEKLKAANAQLKQKLQVAEQALVKISSDKEQLDYREIAKRAMEKLALLDGFYVILPSLTKEQPHD
jgi:hypothetical protein